MNEKHSKLESSYRPRWIASLLSASLDKNPVLVLTGPRQTGKSWLLLNEQPFALWKYLTFDDFNLLAQAEHSPASLWSGVEKIVLDDVQKVPKLLSSIKQSVDNNRSDKKFILSGSANLLLMHKVGESLAGRAVYFPLFPMTLGEISRKPCPDILLRFLEGKFPKPRILKDIISDPYPFMAKGCMPPLLNFDKKEDYLRWWESYIVTYLERDLRQLSQIESLPDFRRLMEAVALRSGQLIKQTEIARDIKMSQATIYRYLNLLETTCLLKRVPAYAKSRTKRLIKSSKIYFIDPGLTSFLCGYFEESSLKAAKETGSIFETLVLLHLIVLSEMIVPKAKIFYWRTVSGKEVDFVLEYGRKVIAMEVKLSSNVEYHDAQGLQFFLAEYPETIMGIVIYTGTEIKYLAEKIIAVPWTLFTGLI